MTTLSVLVLDTARGCPAEGLFVALERHQAKEWHHIDGDAVDEHGQAGLGDADLGEGTYRVTLDTGTYFAANSQPSALPVVRTVFDISADSADSVRICVALGPYGYSVNLG